MVTGLQNLDKWVTSVGCSLAFRLFLAQVEETLHCAEQCLKPGKASRALGPAHEWRFARHIRDDVEW